MIHACFVTRGSMHVFYAGIKLAMAFSEMRVLHADIKLILIFVKVRVLRAGMKRRECFFVNEKNMLTEPARYIIIITGEQMFESSARERAGQV